MLQLSDMFIDSDNTPQERQQARDVVASAGGHDLLEMLGL